MTMIGILGASGRMGRAIAGLLDGRGEAQLAGATARGGDPGSLAEDSDVLIDFTAPDALQAHLDAAIEHGTPIVIGTTGLGPDHHAAIDRAAGRIAVLQSANMSLGVNLLAHLVRETAARLGDDWDIEIVEMHHRHKVDAPSGTALLLGAAVNRGRGAGSPTDLNRLDRMQAGPHRREEGGVYYASLRGGSVAGDHMVVLAAEGERIELGHRAESRAIFATGAVKAALWLADKRAGRYTMKDVLGLS
ncbi:MAG: 4-hydroxy-tetrahydrodipicolinate reductase [Allosphingosinicella sp.]